MMRFPYKRKRKIITALEIDSDWLKIVQVETYVKERKISRIIAEKITSLPDEEISDKIRNLPKEAKINPDLFIICIPHTQVAIRNLELPSTNPAEIKNMVELQVGKQTPFAKEEIIYDYEILNTTADGYSRVMLVIVHKDIVGRIFKILEKARLKTDKIGLGSEGLLRWFQFSCKEKKDKNPYVLIDMNYDASDFEVVWKDKLIFSRNISLSFSKSSDGMNEWREKLIEQINHSIYVYQNEIIDREINKITITGAEELTANFNEDALKEKLGLPIEIIPQFKNIPETDASRDDYRKAIKNISISTLLGFALTYPEQRINLIPQELVIEKGVKERGRDLYLFGIYLVFILVTASSIFLGGVYNKDRYLKQLKEDSLKVREKVEGLDSMMKEVGLIKKRTFTQDFSLNFLYEIHKVLSPELYLASISFDGKEHLILRGTSNNMSEVFKFINALEESKYFKNVKTKYATKRKAEGKELTDFEIICPLAPGLQKLLAENR